MSNDTLSTILFIDDDSMVRASFMRLLRNERARWSLHFAESVDEAIEVCQRESIDLIVSDYNMPGKTGLELLQWVKSDAYYQNVPVVMLTGDTELDLKRRSLEAGAVDLLSKPINKEDLLARLHSTLLISQFQRRLIDQNEQLEQRVSERTRELENSRNELLWRLAMVVEARDNTTGEHIIRVAEITRILAKHYPLPSSFVDALYHTSPLHDVGKIAIPDSILLKPGKLTTEERRVVETHCRIGSEVLQRPLRGSERNTLDNPMLEIAAVIALTHHEKWDGSGYPDGLSGKQIPISGRIVALADVIDALTAKRPYKPAIAFDDAFAMIEEMSGTHFDPDLVEVARGAQAEIRVIVDPQMKGRSAA